MLKNLKIAKKLLISFLLVSIIPIIVFAIIVSVYIFGVMSNNAEEQLKSVRDNKENQIVQYFTDKNSEIKLLGRDVEILIDAGYNNIHTIHALKKNAVEEYFDNMINTTINGSKSETINLLTNSLIKSAENNEILNKADSYISTYIENMGYVDAYVLSKDQGQIMYSYKKGKDLGVMLNSKEHLGEGMYKAWHSVIKEDAVHIEDFSAYTYSGGEQAGFIGAPIKDTKGETIAVFVLQFAKDALNSIVQPNLGLGKSGETYLGTEINSQFGFRSDLLITGDGNYSVGDLMPKSLMPEYVTKTFEGESINEIFKDSKGEMVMVSTTTLNILNLKWIMVTKMDLAEIIAINNTDKENGNYYLNYAEDYNISDLFLVHPDGYVFYSAKEGEEYKTNILNGIYKDTNFAKLIRDINQSKDFSIVDYQKYSPKNDLPEAFVGIPILNDHKGIECILVLQISVDPINKMMKETETLGNSGEAYLVGSDFLMRSDSYLDPINRNVIQSFENPEKGSIKTETVYKVLEGKDGTDHIRDYRGEKVISSYVPIDIYSLNWGLIVEEDESEAYKIITILIISVILLVLITAVLVTIIALFVSKSISRPIIEISSWAQRVAIGDNEIKDIKVNNDEIGDMKKSIENMVKSLNKVSRVCEAIAVGDLSEKFELRSKEDRLGKAVKLMRENFIQVVMQANAIAQNDYNVAIEKRSEKDELGAALINMVTKLKKATEESNKVDFIKSGESEINDIFRQELDNQTLGKKIITFLCKYINAQVGVFMIKDKDNYKLISSYAFNTRKNTNFLIKEGEGLTGQAIFEKELIYIKDVPNEFLTIESTIGEMKANHVLLIPCVYENEVKCVLEIGSYKPFNGVEIELLQQTKENIAIAIHSNNVRKEMQELLDRTLKQSEDLKISKIQLQEQQEELKQSNDELEKQTMELKASESKSQTQQEELRVINEELEEKTENLIEQKNEIDNKNKALMETQKLIEDKGNEIEITSKYKSEFLANMSHELRTPLNSILILSQLMLENDKGSLSENEKEYAKTINTAGEDLLNLINDILDLSKIEAGKMELCIEPFDINSLINDVYSIFLPISNKKEVTLIKTVDNNIPSSIISDEMKIGQIIKNLVSNAVKFTKKGEIEISAKLEGEGNIAIAVRDTGIGIAQDKQVHIFGAFQQADGTTSRKYGGTGLGLAISKELATILGGELNLESKVGYGSTFELVIPIKNKKNLNKIEVKQDLPKIGDADILIIEDDLNFRKILKEMAESRGHKVICVDSGEEGLEIVNKTNIGAIILDIGLPGISGWEVLRQLKKSDHTKDIPIHIMSGKDLDEAEENKGYVNYLKKPISVRNLNKALNKIERLINKNIKQLLIVGVDEKATEDITQELSNVENNIIIKISETGKQAKDLLRNQKFDCIVIDIKLKDMRGSELATDLRKNDITQAPIIIYSERDLSNEENDELEQYIEAVIIEGTKSLNRIVDEAILFLNHIEKNNAHKGKIIMKTSHDKEVILEGKKVLIADDDMRNVFALSSSLESKGMKVIIAKNGKVVLEKLEEHNDIDIVLMDIMMPEMDGYTAIRKIRKLQNHYASIPIIALTAKAMKEDKTKCISAGANDYMSKPVKIDQLIGLMKVWIYK